MRRARLRSLRRLSSRTTSHSPRSGAARGVHRDAPVGRDPPDGVLAPHLTDDSADRLLEVKKDRFGVGRKPRSKKVPEGPAKGRDIPDAIKRAVHERDGGQCTFVGTDGKRCQERGFIELDHLDGFARRQEHVTSRIALRCFQHNQYAAEVMYGPELMARKRLERPRPDRSS